MSAQELTTAAEKLRETAAEVPGVDDDTTPWAEHFGHDGPGTDLCDEDAAWIALMHPGLAEPLAAWLESWDGIDVHEDGPMSDDYRYALAVARAINRSAP